MTAAASDRIEVPVRMRRSGKIVRTPVCLSVRLPSSGAARGPSKIAIIYLHGGGLLFGDRDDLPRGYIEQIGARGHALIGVDYPLAPETAARDIIDAVERAVREIARTRLAELDCTDYALFGRSAGAYLALMVAARLRASGPSQLQPVAIWDFYGYDNLLAPFAGAPNAYYRTMPAVDEASVADIADGVASAPVTAGGLTRRFALYVFARQTGRWPELLGATDPGDGALALSPAEISALPPLFITASTADQDVPFEISKRLSRRAARARLFTVYYLEHDFDRDAADPTGARAYTAALDFLDALPRRDGCRGGDA